MVHCLSVILLPQQHIISYIYPYPGLDIYMSAIQLSVTLLLYLSDVLSLIFSKGNVMQWTNYNE